ncbi:hypothetical protein CEXT_724971 [Caerostris extrusa]|uniref:Uncharacterized protein n=1 Tax=Caerostris extrusa TaxID=172846 RepID=A0AAV4RLU1_CAEEX|nr:hypothetical protein CEXT_724971 [Caerostris extrusa]
MLKQENNNYLESLTASLSRRVNAAKEKNSDCSAQHQHFSVLGLRSTHERWPYPVHAGNCVRIVLNTRTEKYAGEPCDSRRSFPRELPSASIFNKCVKVMPVSRKKLYARWNVHEEVLQHPPPHSYKVALLALKLKSNFLQ